MSTNETSTSNEDIMEYWTQTSLSIGESMDYWTQNSTSSSLTTSGAMDPHTTVGLSTTNASQELQENVTSELSQVTQIVAGREMKIVYIVVGLLGIMGNFLVIFVILNSKSMRSKFTNMFIVNQSLIDFTASLLLVFSNVLDDISLVHGGLGAEFFCRLWLSKLFQWGTFVSSSYNLVFLTFERYFAIVHPLKHSHSFTKTKAKILMVLAWCIGLGYNASYIIPTARVLETGECTMRSEWAFEDAQKITGLVTVCVQFFIPLVLVSYAYIHILYVLHKGSDSGTSTSSNRVDNMQRAKKNVIKTLAIVNVCFILCWSWNQVFYLLFNIGFDFGFTSTFYHFTVILVNVNCCINPFIYSIKFEQFQKSAIKLFCSCCCCYNEDLKGTDTESKGHSVSTISTKDIVLAVRAE